MKKHRDKPMRTLERQKIELFLEYRDNFFSVEGWAAYHMIPERDARKIVTKGRALYYDSALRLPPPMEAY